MHLTLFRIGNQIKDSENSLKAVFVQKNTKKVAWVMIERIKFCKLIILEFTN